MRHPTIIEIGGLSLVVGALAFVGIFAYLAASMDWSVRESPPRIWTI
jgi:hypothetical protein